MSALFTYALVTAFLLTGIILSTRYKKLTLPGALVGGLCGFLIFAGSGITGLILLALFFMLGTIATSWKRDLKPKENIAPRTMSQVLANGGIAALAGLLIIFFPNKNYELSVITAAAISAATADTLSSELGMVYGKRFFNVLSWKKDERGLDGVISWEGLVIGLAGSALIATVYCLGFKNWNPFLLIVIAGTVGNLTDSIIGAAWERKGFIKNDLVNFLCTFSAAAFAFLWLHWG